MSVSLVKSYETCNSTISKEPLNTLQGHWLGTLKHMALLLVNSYEKPGAALVKSYEIMVLLMVRAMKKNGTVICQEL